MAIVKALYSYPVKGLSGHPWQSVDLDQGGTMPWDRAFAIENGPSGFDQAEPNHISKSRFIVLMRFAQLAALTTHFDPKECSLHITRGDEQLIKASLISDDGKKQIEALFESYLQGELRGPAKVLSAPGHSFSDLRSKRLHVLNRASLADAEKVIGRALPEELFRANVILEGLEPWEEHTWEGKTLTTANGLKLQFHKRTQRCNAVNVNLTRAKFEGNLLQDLNEHFGHMDMGVYFEVTAPGPLAVEEKLALAP